MKKLSLLLVLVLSMGACSTKDEGGDGSPTDAFKNQIKGNTYTTTTAAVAFLKNRMGLTVPKDTTITVADDASFVITGMTFTFSEVSTARENLAYYSFDKDGTKKYFAVSISTTDASLSFNVPTDSVADNAQGGFVNVAARKRI